MAWDQGRTGVPATDRVVFALVELEKVRKRYNQLSEEVLADDLLSWTYLLTVGYRKSEEVARIMDAIPSVEDFAKLYGLAVDDPKVIRAHKDALSAEREYKSRQDYLARLEREAAEKGMKEGLEQGREKGLELGLKQGIEQGIEQGIMQGIEQGRERGIESLAAQLVKMGVDPAVIESATAAIADSADAHVDKAE